MAYNSFNLPQFIALIILLFLCGVALSDTDILLEGSRPGWYVTTGSSSPHLGSWFLYNTNIYSVCDYSASREPTNWLRTDFIDVKEAIRIDIVVKYTVRKCRPGRIHCKEDFKLYGYQTSKTSPKPDPLVTPFDFLAEAKPTNVPDRYARPADFNLLNVSIKAKREGLYLAFYDQGACMSLLSVRVSFNYCPEKRKNLVNFVRTVSPFNDSNPTQVEGKCSDQHSRNTTALTAVCTSTGNWKTNDNVRCLCQQGYKYSEKQIPHCKAIAGAPPPPQTSPHQTTTPPKTPSPHQTTTPPETPSPRQAITPPETPYLPQTPPAPTGSPGCNCTC